MWDGTKALSIAVKYLRPYLKQHQLKLSEQQIEVLAANILERAMYFIDLGVNTPIYLMEKAFW